MTSERWQQVKELLEAAWGRDAAERGGFLDEACAHDLELRSEVEALLASDEHGGEFLAAPAMNQVEIGAIAQIPESTSTDSDLAGTRVGRYTIQDLIGKGGMGAVYRAVREDDFRMQVAIKLLKRGTDTDAALGRFRAERQILAGLQHPNIARLLDGGATETGSPYFVMEYVDGAPLLEYAAALTVPRRLQLFRSVCSAVQYAHQNRIVHRDIKPANILVTSEGIPKLLDFGIAKLLHPAADGSTATLTITGARVMTPDYASPEQAKGEPVTPATDVYSLGTVLYELLTGKRAHQVKGYSVDEMLKEICTQDPRKPSSVVKELDADLDNIVLKALRKEPERRYGSAAELSEDLDRFLQNRPVHARPESLMYRGRKFLKRNRVPAVAAGLSAVMILVLVLGLGGFGLKRYGLPQEPLQNLRLTVTAQGFFREGIRLYNGKEFAAGAYALDRAIELNPRMAAAYLWRGYCNSALQHLPQAIADYTRSLELSPDQSEGFGKRGEAYLASGKFDEALADLNRAIKLNPAYTLALRNRSGLYLRRKQYAQAIADCDTALRMNPGTKWAARYKNEARNGIAGLTGGLVAPRLVSPAPGIVFGHFPRDTMLVWSDVPGAVSYVVEWDFKYANTWDAERRGATGRLIRTTQPVANFKFIGSQPGRWRVWAIDPAGQPGPKSDWREFTYTR